MPGLKPGDAWALALQELMFPKVRLFPIGRSALKTASTRPESVLSKEYCITSV